MKYILNIDKFYHFIVGLSIALIAMVLFKSSIISLCVAAVIAFLKELYDFYNIENHTPDSEDFLFTVIGGMFAVLLYGN